VRNTEKACREEEDWNKRKINGFTRIFKDGSALFRYIRKKELLRKLEENME